MPNESFRERNRQRREQNAFEHLKAYAEVRNLPDPERSAREAAAQLHSAEEEGERSQRRRRMARAATERSAGRAVSPATRKGGAAVAAAPAKGAGAVKREAGRGAAKTSGQKTSSKPAAPAAQPAEEQAPSVPHRLEDRTKEQLYSRAQELEIDGRSQMSKDELIEAIRAKS